MQDGRKTDKISGMENCILWQEVSVLLPGKDSGGSGTGVMWNHEKMEGAWWRHERGMGA